MRRLLLLAVMAIGITGCEPSEDKNRAEAAYRRVSPELGHLFGRRVAIRIIKETRILEVYVNEQKDFV